MAGRSCAAVLRRMVACFLTMAWAGAALAASEFSLSYHVRVGDSRAVRWRVRTAPWSNLRAGGTRARSWSVMNSIRSRSNRLLSRSCLIHCSVRSITRKRCTRNQRIGLPSCFSLPAYKWLSPTQYHTSDLLERAVANSERSRSRRRRGAPASAKSTDQASSTLRQRAPGAGAHRRFHGTVQAALGPDDAIGLWFPSAGWSRHLAGEVALWRQ
jgi:hypothetical protein